MTPERSESVQTDEQPETERPRTSSRSKKQVDYKRGPKVQKDMSQETEPRSSSVFGSNTRELKHSTPTVPDPVRDESIDRGETAKAVEECSRQVVTQTSNTSPMLQKKATGAAPLQSVELPQNATAKWRKVHTVRGLGDLSIVEVERPLGVITRVAGVVLKQIAKYSEPIIFETTRPIGMKHKTTAREQSFEQNKEDDKGIQPTLLKQKDNVMTKPQTPNKDISAEPSIQRPAQENVGKRTSEDMREPNVPETASLNKLLHRNQDRVETLRWLKTIPKALHPSNVTRNKFHPQGLPTKEVFEQELVFDRLIGNRDVNGGSPEFLVRWYGYADTEATWEPIVNIPRSAILLYCRRIQVPPPDETVLYQAQSG